MTKPGSVSKALVSNVDYAETFLDVAGVPVPAEMQGRSLTPILAGETPADWRKEFYYHYYEYPQPHHVAPHYGIITDRYKLVRYYGNGETKTDLFDSEKDPLELRSYFGQPGYEAVQADLEARLAKLRSDLKVPAVDDEYATGAKKMPGRNAENGGKNAGKKGKAAPKAPEAK